MGQCWQEDWAVFIASLTKYLNVDVALRICTEQNGNVSNSLDRKWIFSQISDYLPPKYFSLYSDTLRNSSYLPASENTNTYHLSLTI